MIRYFGERVLADAEAELQGLISGQYQRFAAITAK